MPQSLSAGIRRVAESVSTNVGFERELVVKSDIRGHFGAELPPGFYDVFVSATAFSPGCRKVRIRQADQSIQFRLKADPLVVAELAEPIVAAPSRRRKATK
jgi:hypothetical protein